MARTRYGRDAGLATRMVATMFGLGLLYVVVAVVLMTSVLLSLFLARTLVRPLRELMLAAVKVRRGRAREVSVPRLPERRSRSKC